MPTLNEMWSKLQDVFTEILYRVAVMLLFFVYGVYALISPRSALSEGIEELRNWRRIGE